MSVGENLESKHLLSQAINSFFEKQEVFFLNLATCEPAPLQFGVVRDLAGSLSDSNASKLVERIEDESRSAESALSAQQSLSLQTRKKILLNLTSDLAALQGKDEEIVFVSNYEQSSFSSRDWFWLDLYQSLSSEDSSRFRFIINAENADIPSFIPREDIQSIVLSPQHVVDTEKSETSSVLLEVASIPVSFDRNLLLELSAISTRYQETHWLLSREESFEEFIEKGQALKIDEESSLRMLPFELRLSKLQFLSLENPSLFRQLNLRALELIDQRIREAGGFKFELELQKMYHQLLVSETRPKALQFFEKKFKSAMLADEFVIADRIVTHAEFAQPFLSNQDADLIRYRRCRLNFFQMRWTKAIPVLEQIVSESTSETVSARARALLAVIFLYKDFPAKAATLAFEAFSWFSLNSSDNRDNKTRAAWSLLTLGQSLIEAGHHLEALFYLELSANLWRDIKNIQNLARTNEQIAFVHLQLGDYQYAERVFEECLQVYRDKQTRNSFSEAWCLKHLGMLSEKQGELDLAVDYYHQAVQLFNLINDYYGEAKTLRYLIFALIGKRHYRDALGQFRRLSALVDFIGDGLGEGRKLNFLIWFFKKGGILELLPIVAEKMVTEVLGVRRIQVIEPAILAGAGGKSADPKLLSLLSSFNLFRKRGKIIRWGLLFVFLLYISVFLSALILAITNVGESQLLAYYSASVVILLFSLGILEASNKY